MTGSQETVAESHWVLVKWDGLDNALPAIARVHAFMKFTDEAKEQLAIDNVAFLALV